MKIVMTLLVRDADDLIAANLDFHLEMSVDHFIVMDNLSTDKTRDILHEYEKRNLVTYISQADDTFSQARWVTGMARLAYDQGADWVINNDADEFWYPSEFDLKHVLSQVSHGYQAVAVERSHFVPRRLASGDFFADALTIRFVALLNPMGKPWIGKVCHRAHPSIEVGYGNHTVSIGGGAIPTTSDAPLEILHFPMRSYDKFEAIVVKGGEANERNPDRPVKRWHDLYQVWKRGELRAYFDAQVPDADAIEAGLRDGRYVVDERLKQMLKRLRSNMVLPRVT
jgi:hypothetical protein